MEVRLRALSADDAEPLRPMFDDPAIQLWNPLQPPDPTQWVAAVTTEDSRSATFAVINARDGRLLGTASLFSIDAEQGTAEAGYRVLAAERGTGVGTAALRRLADHGFTTLGLRRIQLFHALANPASCVVARRAGFQVEGVLRASYVYGDGEPRDEHLHARLSEDPPYLPERKAPVALPDPTVLHPVAGTTRVVLLKPLVQSPLVEVGDFSYYDDPEHTLDFESRNVLHHYGPERLRIGRFCAIATGTKFLMNGANHRMSGPSTFPFPIMGGSWAQHLDLITDLPSRGDTVIDHDVWLGSDVTVMPGVHIRSGAVVATGAVVTDDVPPYAVVGGNPARLIKMRYGPSDINTLLDLAWWDWPLDAIDRPPARHRQRDRRRASSSTP